MPMNRSKLAVPIFLLIWLPVILAGGVMMSMKLFSSLYVYAVAAYAAAGLLTTVYGVVWFLWNPEVNVRNYWLLNGGAWLFYGIAHTAGLYAAGKMVAPDLGFLFASGMMVFWLPVTYFFWFRRSHNFALKRGWD